jgi:hypothetical protein
VRSAARMIILSIALLPTAASVADAADFTVPFHKSIAIDGPLQLTIVNAAGRVEVQPSTDNSLTVDAVKHVAAADQREADSVAAVMEIEITALEKHYTIRPTYPGDDGGRSESFWQKLLGKSGGPACGSVDITVSAPSDCAVDITCRSGDIAVDGLEGAVAVTAGSGDVAVGGIFGGVTVTTASGDIDVRNTEGSVTVAAQSGDIGCRALTGPVDIRNQSGRTICEDVAGDVGILQPGGRVELKQINGDVRIKAGSGRIIVDQQSGALTITAESGDIDVKTFLASDKDFLVETASGSITFAVPASASGSVRMETGSGSLDADLPLTFDIFEKTRITGDFGDGGPKISLSTLSGDIKLGEYR